MKIRELFWHKQASADEVCIIVDVPDSCGLSTDYFFEHKCLVLYGRRTGKLRAKLIPFYDAFKFRGYRGHNMEYSVCKPDLNQVKFKHLIPQVEKHLSWAILSA